MGSEPVAALLREFSLPATVGMLVNALYVVVDRFYIGQGCGSGALAGISLAFPFSAILTAFGTLIGVGSGSLLSLTLGEKKRADAEKVLGQCVALKLLFFLTLPFAILPAMGPLLLAFGGTPEGIPFAREYLRITLCGNVFAHLSYGLANLMRAEGQAARSMHCMLIGAVLNAVLDPVFIFGLKMGVAGAAWATVLSMFATAVYAFWFYLSGRSAVRMRLRRIRVYPAMAARVFAVGLSPFLMQLMAGAITVAYNRMFTKWAPTTGEATVQIAALGIVHSLFFLFLLPVFGITQGMQPIAGYNHGAGLYGRVRSVFRLAMRDATAVCLAAFLIVLVFAYPLMRCFTSDPALLAAGVPGIRIYSCMFGLIGIPIVTVAYYQSIGRARAAILLSLLRQFFLLLPMIVLFPFFWGILGIWIAAPASDFLSSALTDIVSFKELRALKKKEGVQL